jgi:glycosyltransferase involved in cell wall biosynthesis
MVPLEAQACGRPVIAFGAGGSLETVRGSGLQRTGVYFAQQTVESIMEGIRDFETAERGDEFIPEQIQGWASEFATPIFIENMRNFLLSTLPQSTEAMVAPVSP